MARLLAEPPVFILALWLVVWGWARMPSFSSLTPGERDAVMARLRGGEATVSSRALAGPVFVTVYDKGTPSLHARS